MRFADKVKGFEGENPFSDKMPRAFSDRKIYKEFYPISLFWTLFNDQHEILLGSRGSGKTFLLKMMRYSMLNKIDNPRAVQIVNEKKYIAMYVPMRAEFISPITNSQLNDAEKLKRFQEGFNCLLCVSLICEIKSLLEEISDFKLRISKQISLVSELEKLWFGESTGIGELYELSDRVNEYYAGIDWDTPSTSSYPALRKQICFPLMIARSVLTRVLDLDDKDPTWIVCVDEAEYLSDIMQRSINDFLRSDSNRVVMKVATLPYYHITFDTLNKGKVSDVNDYNYRMIDLSFEDADFIRLTNSLCKNRLKERFSSIDICESLEDFVGEIGNDDYIDYYLYERNKNKTGYVSYEEILSKIKESFSERRKKNADNYTNPRKSLFDRFAVVYYTREMRDYDQHRGNSCPGWYAGAKMIRRISQGNPRMYIQAMGALFEKARTSKLTPKAQHKVLYNYANSICEATKSIEQSGPIAYRQLNNISMQLSAPVSNLELLSSTNAFTIKFKDDEELQKNKAWIELSVAYSRLLVDSEAKRSGITKETRYVISNAYAFRDWIPMHSDGTSEITLGDVESNGEREIDNQINESPFQLTIEEIINDKNT